MHAIPTDLRLHRIPINLYAMKVFVAAYFCLCLFEHLKMLCVVFLCVCICCACPHHTHITMTRQSTGTAGANNYPLKGGKMNNWEGGIRVNAFISGGFVAEASRGTTYEGLVTGWDHYATFCALAGVDKGPATSIPSHGRFPWPKTFPSTPCPTPKPLGPCFP